MLAVLVKRPGWKVTPGRRSQSACWHRLLRGTHRRSRICRGLAEFTFHAKATHCPLSLSGFSHAKQKSVSEKMLSVIVA